ncbi:DUF4249 family protein [Tenacibaculum finnmarkense]|uniref:Lipoprotein n=1 Tax=Tenacibaculum finnmarkense genomovar ulcerans TaxID=2781388 RepID=A0A2I2MAZ5_9FLAO|nr:DUF4249 family protein [Tenacibaculum finnmarkense]ALU74087.1 hypothetical protein AUW17_01820 [Tenacibaculum dicentrarchi]MBE7698032.1 DUF4249 family protein [Tenacibaculum finnmarkense genomovar ulcerans]MCD8410284.1 DUF4249 domain-containing protein [Tenacibaculum finnmarkense genomovar ulcerans]MCD8432817.1 DUF4249 domain-containing protein [Tenacibaculum finnmarkense genomovar ulcerans]MCG8733870.1 DUF4249 family protein [Tenacibaculum finnmarkense]
MKSPYILFIIFISIFTFFGCSKTIPLDDIYEPHVIVRGGITKNNIIFVDLQQTVPVSVITKKPINTAKVSLHTKAENSAAKKIADVLILDEKEGKYAIKKEFNPMVGNYYWIKIILEDGTILESVPELFKPKVVLNKITKEDEGTRITFEDFSGDKKDFYLITYTFYTKQGDVIFTDFLIENDVFFEEGEAAFFEIEDISDSVEVEMSSISFNTYNFLKSYLTQIETQEIADGDFFSQLFSGPPANLEGNIINKATGRKALGFFELFNPTVKKQDF